MVFRFPRFVKMCVLIFCYPVTLFATSIFWLHGFCLFVIYKTHGTVSLIWKSRELHQEKRSPAWTSSVISTFITFLKKMYSWYCYIMQKMNTCEFDSMAGYGNLNQSQVLIDIQQLWTTRECDFLEILLNFTFRTRTLFYNINIVMLFLIIAWREHFDDTKVVIRDRNSKTDK